MAMGDGRGHGRWAWPWEMGVAMGDGHGRARAHLPAVVADRGLERLGVLRRPEVDGAVEAARDEELGVHGVPCERGDLRAASGVGERWGEEVR